MKTVIFPLCISFLYNNVQQLRLIRMYPSGASEPTVVYKEQLFVDEHWFLMKWYMF